MDELISRQAAIEIIQSMYPGMPRVPWMRKDWQKRYEPYIRTENAIRKLPSAQKTMYYPQVDGITPSVIVPSAQRKGKWIRENIVLTSTPPQYQWHCSGCGRLVRGFSTEILTDFCPNCGAEMRGEE